MNTLKLRKNNFVPIIFMMITLIFIIGFGTQSSASAQQSDFETVYPAANNEFFTNPGIGWQRMEHNRPVLSEEAVVYPTREDISWMLLNPGLGNYNWSILDDKIEAADNNGQQFSFRIYTMQGEEYGGHKVPQWVLNRDNSIIQGGDPNYSNCTYQTYWGMFVNELRLRYDGDTRIAFIDISGYGNFNEWSWTDGQTVWDDSFENPGSVDGQARVRLADMFIGGSDNNHSCEGSNGSTQSANYSYVGFQTTQLVMPFAGIQQSTRYVASRRDDIGIRYDCLGRDATLPKIDDVIEATWRTAPIVFEFCAFSTTRSDVMNRAETLMNSSHGAIVHENLENPRDEGIVEDFMTNVGYRYQLTQAVYDTNVAAGEELSLSMAWQNIGTSPAYTSMGYDFAMHVYLIDSNGNVAVDYTSDANVTWWMPAHPLPGTAPTNAVGEMVDIPSNLQDGTYDLRVAIINTVTGEPINLAIQGDDGSGRYELGTVTVDGEGVPTSEPPTEEPTEIPTEIPTEVPTEIPTEIPTDEPTEIPSEEPPTGGEPPSGANDSIYISSLDGEVHRINNNNWVARFTIEVENADGESQSGVSVTGTWHDGIGFTCITNNRGFCRVRKSRIAFDQSASMVVTTLTHSEFDYDPAANLDSPIAIVSFDEQPATEVPVTEVPVTAEPTNPPIIIIATSVGTSEPPTGGEPPVQPTTIPPVQPTTIPPVQPTTVPPVQPTTVPPVVGGNYVYVHEMDTQSWRQGRGRWTTYIDIEIRDSNGRAPSGVVITGVWQDGTPYTCTTSGGWCGARLTNIPSSVGTSTLTITNLSYPSFSFNASQGVTSATVNR